MPTLLQINTGANWGSTGTIAEQIGELSMNSGWDSFIAYGRNANPSKSHLIKIGTTRDVYEHALYSRITGRHGLASSGPTRKIIEHIDRIKPDIVHLHNIHGYYINYKLLFEYLNKGNTPIVWTLHDCWSFTGHCAHFVEINCEKWKTHCRSCPIVRDYPCAYYDRSYSNFELKRELFSYNKNLHIIPVSQWLAGFVRQSFLKSNDIRVFHNGIDLSLFHPQNTSISNKFLIIGVSSIWNRAKGLYDFYNLRRLLDAARYDIMLVGLSERQIKDLPDGIIGIKRTNSMQELAMLYSAADVFVNPTYADTFPTTNLEALACGIPVVTYRTGGSPEAVTPETGIVVEQGDIAGLSNAIQAIEGKRKGFFRDICRAHAEESFDKWKCFHRYIDLYNTILDR